MTLENFRAIWSLKRSLSSDISTNKIDEIYIRAKEQAIEEKFWEQAEVGFFYYMLMKTSKKI